jgi:hypothetical protein
MIEHLREEKVVWLRLLLIELAVQALLFSNEYSRKLAAFYSTYSSPFAKRQLFSQSKEQVEKKVFSFELRAI